MRAFWGQILTWHYEPIIQRQILNALDWHEGESLCKEELWIYPHKNWADTLWTLIISRYNAPLLHSNDGITIADDIITVLDWYSGKEMQQSQENRDKMKQIKK